MRKITEIIVHCSASRWGSAAEIKKWHLARGFEDIGYHFVILNGKITPHLEIKSLRGSIELGRPLSIVGAHAAGHNDESVGICLIGEDCFTAEQLNSLANLCEDLVNGFMESEFAIRGHGELPGVNKLCPGFPMEWFRKYFEGRRKSFSQ